MNFHFNKSHLLRRCDLISYEDTASETLERLEVTKLQTEELEQATRATDDINNPINVINKTPGTPGNIFTSNLATTQRYKTCYNCGGAYTPIKNFAQLKENHVIIVGNPDHRTRGRYEKPLNNISTSESLYEEDYSSDDHEYLFTLPTVGCINPTHENTLHKESQYILTKRYENLSQPVSLRTLLTKQRHGLTRWLLHPKAATHAFVR